jgi:hypothetical protein
MNDVTVRELARRSLAAGVTSMYLDVDGRRHPRPSDWVPHADHLYRLAREHAEFQGRTVAKQVEADIARIAAWIDNGIDRTTTRGIAVFSCEAEGYFEAFELPAPVRDQVVIGPSPDVAQLAAILARARETLVVAVDHQRSRLLRLGLGEIEEHEGPLDEIERAADTDVEIGSWERRHEEQLREHCRKVARAATSEFDAKAVAHVVLSGTEENTAGVRHFLPERLSSIVRGRLSVPITAGRTELADAAAGLVREVERRAQLGAIQELRDRAAEAAGAVSALGPVLEALGNGTVVALFVEEGYEADGGRCLNCDQLTTDSAACPRCEAPTVALENVVDAAVSEAFARHVELHFCERDDLAELGRIGAVQRR